MAEAKYIPDRPRAAAIELADGARKCVEAAHDFLALVSASPSQDDMTMGLVVLSRMVAEAQNDLAAASLHLLRAVRIEQGQKRAADGDSPTVGGTFDPNFGSPLRRMT
jgi:hypothetical protein